MDWILDIEVCWPVLLIRFLASKLGLLPAMILTSLLIVGLLFVRVKLMDWFGGNDTHGQAK